MGGNTTRGVNVAAWNNATRNAAPTGSLSQFAALNTMNVGSVGKSGRRGQGGALDVDNWQMNRTAQLRIDNVAGANLYATGVRMG